MIFKSLVLVVMIKLLTVLKIGVCAEFSKFFAIKVKHVRLIFNQQVKILVVILLLALIHRDCIPSKGCSFNRYT